MSSTRITAAKHRAIGRAARTARRFPRLRWRLIRARGCFPRSAPAQPLARIIFEFGRAHPKATFVQVGANDGRSGDPLRDEIRFRDWRGVMVEPVPHVFEALRSNYAGNPRVALEMSAISKRDGSRPLYHLAPAGGERGSLPEWYDELGTFHREVIEKHRRAIPDFDSRLRVLEVECVTFEALCRKHGLERVDLIQIDTEGHDFEILKLVDLPRLKPRLLMYEHLHLDDATRRACSGHLARHGYEQLADAANTVCLRVAGAVPRDGRLLRVWRELQAERPVTISRSP